MAAGLNGSEQGVDNGQDTFHNAFDRTNLLISDLIFESAIRELATMLETTYNRDECQQT